MTEVWNRVREWYKRLPSAIRAAWNTAWIVFVGMMLTILTNLLPAVADLISTRDTEAFYDSLSVAATAAVSAATAFLVAIVNAIYRWLRPVENSYTRDTPAEPGDDPVVR